MNFDIPAPEVTTTKLEVAGTAYFRAVVPISGSHVVAHAYVYPVPGTASRYAIRTKTHGEDVEVVSRYTEALGKARAHVDRVMQQAIAAHVTQKVMYATDRREETP